MMEKTPGILRLEKTYGVKIEDDSYYNPITRRVHKQYRLYTADGCPWENGLSYKGLLQELKKYRLEILAIKRYMDARTERGL